jgi:hypothetical protein
MRTVLVVKVGRPYTAFQFLADLVMIPLTGGLWVIWMLVRR